MQAESKMAANGSLHDAERVDLQIHKQHSICMVLDYGSQYTQLIARRVRENNVCSLLLPGDATLVSQMTVSSGTIPYCCFYDLCKPGISVPVEAARSRCWRGS